MNKMILRDTIYNHSSYQYRSKKSKAIENIIDYIPIGSRSLGINDSNSDYNYLMIVSENEVHKILASHNKDYIIYDKYNILGRIYRIHGTNNHLGSRYDILILIKPDNMNKDVFLLHNPSIYSIFRIISLSRNISAPLKLRLKAIKQWTKKNNIYGYPYPNGIAYLIYAINSLEKGYSLKEAKRMIYNRCLYQHSEYGTYHIDYVANKTFNRMKYIEQNKSDVTFMQYRIITPCLPLVLMYSTQFIDNIEAISYIDTNGIIYATKDISVRSNEIIIWKKYFLNHNIEIDIV